MARITESKVSFRQLTGMPDTNNIDNPHLRQLLDAIIENINKLFGLLNGESAIQNILSELISAMGSSDEFSQFFANKFEEYIKNENLIEQIIEKVDIKSSNITVVTGISINEEDLTLDASTRTVKVLGTGVSGKSSIDLITCTEETV